MIQLKRITSKEKVTRKLLQLYENAFPDAERRENEALLNLIDTEEQMFFCEILFQEKCCGFICYWQFKQFVYLEHFAIFPEMRNLKIGGNVLNLLKNRFNTAILFEVEPEIEDFQKKRIRFYEQNGFSVLTKEYVQPSYVKGGDTCSLWIMGNSKPQKLYQFLNEIKEAVYTAHY